MSVSAATRRNLRPSRWSCGNWLPRRPKPRPAMRYGRRGKSRVLQQGRQRLQNSASHRRRSQRRVATFATWRIKPAAICPKRVRYIKLGKRGSWEKECLEKNIIRFGFGTERPKRFRLCQARQWDKLRRLFIEGGRDNGTATHFTNQLRLFFQDRGCTLWITFVGECLYWGSVAPGPPKRHADGHGVYRVIAGRWRGADLKGEQLTKDRLSGALTQLAAYRGTSCDVNGPVKDYVIRRINGEKTPEVERALAALEKMRVSVLELMKLLGPRDFETLVDLVFSTSGWRRLGVVGKIQKTLDLDLILPSTGDRALVQVKSKTTSAELAQYVGKLEEYGPFDRMFYVFHSGEAKTDDPRVTVIGPEKLAELVLDEGLTNWLIRKVA